jgi:IS605 OrfB family transposase
VKLIAQLKLLPTPAQADALRRTLEGANAARNAASRIAWDHHTFRAYDLQKLCYHDLKTRYQLSAQLVIRCLAKVGDSYKLNRTRQRAYAPHGSIAYDDRILSWNLHAPAISIWTMNGRQAIPFVAGTRQVALLHARKGETDLAYRDGQFYLLAVCVVDEPTPDEVDGVLGVDLGVTNIATTSDGEIVSGAHIKNVRYRQRRLRQKLQRKGTRSARRRLSQLRGQEHRFATDTNHVIAKRLVQQAKRTKRRIALEDLTHIRTRVRAQRPQRVVLHSWAFRQLRSFIAYKARLAGVPVVLVDPRNESRVRCVWAYRQS